MLTLPKLQILSSCCQMYASACGMGRSGLSERSAVCHKSWACRELLGAFRQHLGCQQGRFVPLLRVVFVQDFL